MNCKNSGKIVLWCLEVGLNPFIRNIISVPKKSTCWNEMKYTIYVNKPFNPILDCLFKKAHGIKEADLQGLYTKNCSQKVILNRINFQVWSVGDLLVHVRLLRAYSERS